MKKIYFSSLILASFVVASCTQVEFSERAEQSKKVISITAFASRSNVIVDKDIRNNGFVFLGYNNTTTWSESGSATKPNIYNRVATYSNDSWSYTPIEYWPDNGYESFFAYAPKNNNNGISISGEEETGAPYINFSIANDYVSTPDLVTDARDEVKNKKSTDGTISFKLSHVLSRIAIIAKCSSAQPAKNHFYISSISLKSANNNLFSKAKYDFSNDKWDYSNTTNKTEIPLDGLMKLITKNDKKVIEVNANGDKTDIISEDDSFLAIPANNDTGITNNGDVQLVIKYYTSYEDNSGNEIFSSEQTSTIDLPSGSLKKGQFVTYTLNISTIISIMDIKINDWEEVSKELYI